MFVTQIRRAYRSAQRCRHGPRHPRDSRRPAMTEKTAPPAPPLATPRPLGVTSVTRMFQQTATSAYIKRWPRTAELKTRIIGTRTIVSWENSRQNLAFAALFGTPWVRIGGLKRILRWQPGLHHGAVLRTLRGRPETMRIAVRPDYPRRDHAGTDPIRRFAPDSR